MSEPVEDAKQVAGPSGGPTYPGAADVLSGALLVAGAAGRAAVERCLGIVPVSEEGGSGALEGASVGPRLNVERAALHDDGSCWLGVVGEAGNGIALFVAGEQSGLAHFGKAGPLLLGIGGGEAVSAESLDLARRVLGHMVEAKTALADLEAAVRLDGTPSVDAGDDSPVRHPVEGEVVADAAQREVERGARHVVTDAERADFEAVFGLGRHAPTGVSYWLVGAALRDDESIWMELGSDEGGGLTLFLAPTTSGVAHCAVAGEVLIGVSGKVRFDAAQQRLIRHLTERLAPVPFADLRRWAGGATV